MSKKSDLQKRQRKLEQKRKKHRRHNEKQRARTHEPFFVGRLSGSKLVAIEIAELCAEEEYEEARDLLQEYLRHNDASIDLLRTMREIYFELEEYAPLCAICERLAKVGRSPSDQLTLAAAYLGAVRPASTVLAFKQFLEQWPNDPMADEVRGQIATMEPLVDEMLESTPFPPAERYELAALHEKVLSLLQTDYEGAVEAAETLLARCPDFVPALNNVTHAYFQMGRLSKALAAAEIVLNHDPENVHALSNLVRILCLTNRLDEAKELAKRLRTTNSTDPDRYSKQAEGLTFLGDDEGVITALRQAEKAGVTREKSPDVAMLYHLGATAFARQGEKAAAKKYWRKTLKVMPGFQITSRNLADSELPVSEQHGPWAYGLEYWVPRPVVEELMDQLATRGSENEAQTEKIVNDYVKKHPEIVALVPRLLESGDLDATEFAKRFAFLVGSPETYDALRKFVAGCRGSDELRSETALYLVQQNELPPGPQRMWIDGQWTEIEIHGLQVSGEPVDWGHSPEVDRLAQQAVEAMHDRDFAKAESILQEAIALESDKPDLLNNLAATLEGLGEKEEAYRMIREIHSRWPDYFFGRIGMANRSVDNGDLDKAEEYLSPLRSQQQLHESEFSARCTAEIRLAVALDHVDEAKRWYEIWEDILPDDSRREPYQHLRMNVSLRDILRRKISGK